METLRVVLEPVDPLFFRDARPFEAGLDTRATSRFPSPLAVYGAVAEHVLKRTGADMVQFLNGGLQDSLLGPYDAELKSSLLYMKGPYPFLGETWVPVPRGLSDFPHRAVLPSSETPAWDIDNPAVSPLRWPQPENGARVFVPAEGYLSLRSLCSHPSGPLGTSEVRAADGFYQGEQRIGHKVNRIAGTVAEGFLYETERLRFVDRLDDRVFRKAALSVYLNNLGNASTSLAAILQPNDILFLGGERGRVAVAGVVAEEEWVRRNSINAAIQRTGKFFLCLTTPAIFDQGWKPASWPAEFAGTEMVGAAIGKPVLIGGWQRTSSADGRPRPLRRAVPSGSMYFFQTKDGNGFDLKPLIEKYHFNESLSHEFPCAGFGIAILGAWGEKPDEGSPP